MTRHRELSHDGDGGEVTDDGCRALWCAVIMRAAADIAAPEPAKRVNGNDMNGREWRQARDWIGSRDFREVCALAGLEPEPVEAWLRSLMASGARRRGGRGFEWMRA